MAGHGEVLATDLSERCVEVLERKYGGLPHVTVHHGEVTGEDVGHDYDSVVLVNVLEHVDDDAGFLAQLAQHLRPGGRIVIFVPAFETLYSDFDRAIGHHRRYRQSTMATTVDKAGLEIDDLRYVNSVGAVAWWAMVKQLRQTPARSAAVKLFDRGVVPVLRKVEARRPPRFGQSVFCVARRPEVAE